MKNRLVEALLADPQAPAPAQYNAVCKVFTQDAEKREIGQGGAPDQKFQAATRAAFKKVAASDYKGPCEVILYEDGDSLAFAYGNTPQEALDNTIALLRQNRGRF